MKPATSDLALDVSDLHTLGLLSPLAALPQPLSAASPSVPSVDERPVVLQGLALVVLVIVLTKGRHGQAEDY